MKELDLALLSYLERFYEKAPPAEQQSFDELLEWRDPEMLSFLLGSSAVPDGPGWRQLRQRLSRERNHCR